MLCPDFQRAQPRIQAGESLDEIERKLGRPLEPGYGDDVLKQIKDALNQSPETIALLKEAMSKK